MEKLAPTFREKRVESTYTVLDHESMAVRSSHKYLLESVGNQRFYSREYFWDSAGGIEKDPMLLSGRDSNGMQRHRVLKPVIQEPDGRRIAVVDLGRTFSTGETEELEMEYFFVSVAPKPPSFVGYIAREGCEHVELHAILPRRILKSRVLSRVWMPGAANSSQDEPMEPDVPVKSQWISRPDDWVHYSFKVPAPSPGWKYRIQWDH